MKKTEVLNTTQRESFNTPVEPFTGLFIHPTRCKHPSGYRYLDLVAAQFLKPALKMTGGCDVVQFFHPACGISPILQIDAMGDSGIIHVYSNDCLMTIGPDLSTTRVDLTEIKK